MTEPFTCSVCGVVFPSCWLDDPVQKTEAERLSSWEIHIVNLCFDCFVQAYCQTVDESMEARHD